MLSQVVYSKNGMSEAFQLLSKAEPNKKSAQEYEYLHSCDRCGKRLSGIEALILEHETGLCIPCDIELEKDVESRRRLPKLVQLKLNSML